MDRQMVPYQQAAAAAYGEPIRIVSSGRLGHAHDGRNRYLVGYTQHDRAWPGATTQYPATTFAVSREGPNGVDASWGFHTEDEAWDFLTGLGPQEYLHWSPFGQPIVETRERLAIPDGMIKRYQANVATGLVDAAFRTGPTTEQPAPETVDTTPKAVTATASQRE
jgi:hypothetical protein